MAYYKISDTSLTAIGDAIREHTGKHTREEYVPVTDNYYHFSIDTTNPVDVEKFAPASNATGANDYTEIYTFRNAYQYLIVYDSQIVQPGSYIGIDTTYVEITPYNSKNSYGNSSYKFKLNCTNCGSSEYIMPHVNDFDGLKLFFRYRTDEEASMKVSFEIYALDENGEIINEELVTVKDTMTPGEMAQEISELIMMPNEAFNITGACSYRFSNDGWNWLINQFGDKITTTDISGSDYMFAFSSKLKSIPFEINYSKSTYSNHDLNHMFYGCDGITEVPKLNNAKVTNLSYMFESCKNIRYMPEGFEDWFDWSYMESQTSGYSGSVQRMFCSCFSLRTVPLAIFKHMNQYITNSYIYWNYGFNYCHALDELVGMPIPKSATWTSNSFSGAFDQCRRLKELTFEVQEDGTPIVVNWTKQTIDLTKNVGHFDYNTNLWDESNIRSGINSSEITKHNSGITADKIIYDEATYAALKDDPDAFCLNNSTNKGAYSRYNHNSAVNTINSLPDCSAKGGNTIKFTGAAGSATDGGAINTLTAEEIAVATAKGWTVSFA